MNTKNKNYFPDLVKQEFTVPQPNIHWYTDYSEIIIDKNNKFHLFFLIDGCYNEIIKIAISHNKIICATDTIRRIEATLKERRIVSIKEPKLIVHSDRGTQFSSKAYLQFTEKCRENFTPSMSPMCSPTHNAVVERFIRTFKGLKFSSNEFEIDNQNIEGFLTKYLKNEEFQINKKIKMDFIRKVLLKYVDFYNKEKKTLKAPQGAIINNHIFNETKDFLTEPKYIQSYSLHSAIHDKRRDEIENYKSQLITVWNEISEALPDNISFSEAKPILLIKLRTIESKIDNQYILSLDTKRDTEDLIDGQQNLIEGQKLTMTAIGQVGVAIKELQLEIQQLKQKKKIKVEKIQLRDPIYENNYEIFMNGAGLSIVKKLKNVRVAQLKIIYTLLFFLGLRINEIKSLTKNDLILAIETAEINVIHTKTGSCQKHVLPYIAKKKLADLLPEIFLLFDTYGFEFLGNSKRFSGETFSNDNFIRFINSDINAICSHYSILDKFSSHSFRVGYITKLLRTVPVQKVASIIGHKDIDSTMSYQRYIINKVEIQELLKSSFE